MKMTHLPRLVLSSLLPNVPLNGLLAILFVFIAVDYKLATILAPWWDIATLLYAVAAIYYLTYTKTMTQLVMSSEFVALIPIALLKLVYVLSHVHTHSQFPGFLAGVLVGILAAAANRVRTQVESSSIDVLGGFLSGLAESTDAPTAGKNAITSILSLFTPSDDKSMVADKAPVKEDSDSEPEVKLDDEQSRQIDNLLS